MMPTSPTAQSDEKRSVTPSQPPQLAVSLFGGCQVSYGGREIVVPNRKARALIGHLAFAPNQTETRERIAGLLWSETDEDKARASLRQLLRTLRDLLAGAGFEGFTTLRERVGFEAGTVRFDVWEAAESIAKGSPIDALLDRSRICETLLEGFDDVDSSFHTWLLVQRESLHQRMLRELHDRLESASATSSTAADVRRIAQALLQLDPTHEPACRCLMRCHADAGDSATAIETYNRLWKVLGEFHDMEPSEATQALIADIKSGIYRPPALTTVDNRGPILGFIAASAPEARPEKLVLVVGNFVHSGSRNQLAFAFRHELLTRLSKFREWALVDGEPKTLSDPVAGPHYLLSAPMIEGDGDVNLMLTLKDGRTGQVVWGERYNIALATFFQSLQEVMCQIAAKLNVYISVERIKRLAAAPALQSDLYDRWLLGQSLIFGWRGGDRARLKEILESITRDAAAFSPAYSALAQQNNSDHIVLPGIYRTPAIHQEALLNAKRAVQLDPLDSRAQLALAWANAMSDSHDVALSHFDQACALNEFDSWTITSAALGYAFANEPERARSAAEKAEALTPSPTALHWCYQSNVKYVCGDYEGSLLAAAHSGDVVTNLPAWRAAALAHLGRVDEARTQARHFVDLIRPMWRGKATPTDATIVRWFLHCFPFRDPATRASLRSGLAAAGLQTN